MFSFNRCNVDINDLKVSCHSLVNVSDLFFPISGGNYFSISYKGETCNIMNMSLENFKELKNRIKEIELIEIIKDDISTNGYILYSKDLDPKWYIKGLWTYNVNISINDKELLIEYLKEKKYGINYLTRKEIVKEDIEQIIIDKTNSMIKKHVFNYIDNEDTIWVKTKEFLKNNIDNDNVKNEELNKIFYLEKLNSMKYKFCYSGLNQIKYNIKPKDLINFDDNFFGYTIFNKENNKAEHFIVVNTSFNELLKKYKKYNEFKENCQYLTEDGVDKFYNLLEKEKEENYKNLLNGNSISKESTIIYFQQFLDKLNGSEYINYLKKDNLEININLLVEKLFENKILNFDNELYAKANSTKTSYTCIYFYELVIENIINENEFIARLNSNKNTFYYFKFTKIDDKWNFELVKRKTETIINYI